MEKIFTSLWLVLDNQSLFETKKNLWKNSIPFRYKKGIQKIDPDYFFIQENKPIIFFFNGAPKKEKYNQIWNLWWVPLIYIMENGRVTILNGFDFDTKNEFFHRVDSEDISIIDIISWRKYEKLNKKDNQVDNELLDNLRNAKVILERYWLKDIYAQNIIWRLLFSRFLIDNNVSIDKKFFTNKADFLHLIGNKVSLYEYFNYLKDRFHWDLFPIEEDERIIVNATHLNILTELFSWNTVGNNFIQISLFDKYNFEIIPVELISEVYEQFMWEDKQRNEWAYYTPSFLVDYILEKTVRKFLRNATECKVFDPSCWSWIFLVEAFRMIVERNLDDQGYIEINALKEILQKNIFWVDKNYIAINLTIFSLYLTLLDYVNPKDLGNFTFPEIRNRNLFVSDFFDQENDFNNSIQNVDFILWNPPWWNNKDLKHINYITAKKIELWYKKNEILVSDNQIAQSFILKIKDIADKNTVISLVLPSKILYNFNAKEFRSFILNNFKINEILELSPVRKKLFSWAIAPTIVMTLENSISDINTHLVHHISIKPNIFLNYLKILVIEKNDIKDIQQVYFLKYDYLWKIILYWNIFDFNLLKRLKEDFPTLNDVINENNLLYWQWIQIGWWDKNDSTHLMWKKFLTTSNWKKGLFRFFINDSVLDKFSYPLLHRIRNKSLFEKWPKLLLKKGFNGNDYSNVVAYTENEYVFTDSITSIYWENKDMLKYLCWLLNSIFFNYFILLQWSSSGTEREQWHNEWDRFNVPTSFNKDIWYLVSTIQSKYTEFNNETIHTINYDNDIRDTEMRLNESILNSFSLTALEKSLIDYSKDISIPLINNDFSVYESASEEYLSKYAQIFLDEFNAIWWWPTVFFEIDIYYNSYVVWMNFKIVNSKRKNEIEFITNNDSIEYIFNLLNIGEERISKEFYKIRDIRWFNKNAFYLVKFNQKKNWHVSLAYQDISEFKDAMIISGLKKINNNSNKYGC